MQQSHDQLTERLDHAIRRNPRFNGRSLRIEAVDGKVVLKGRVSTYFEKQMAQESLRGIEGIEAIDNELEVNWP